ncbi:cytochrome c biogenesis CcdA family protein [Chloroflexota bacterium]
MENISLLVAFGAGLLSFLSPCVLPLVPVYLASLCGPGIFEPEINRIRLPIFLHSLSFVVGFSAVFILLGLGAGLAGIVLASRLVDQIAGGLLIVFGIFLIAALKIPWLNYEQRFAPSMGRTTGYLRSFLIGAIFSLAWTPCVGPILGSILALALTAETAGRGALLLAVYSLGLGLPFLIIGAAFGYISPLLKRIQRYSRIIYVIGGLLLIAAGVLILTGKLTALLSW